MEIIVRGTPKQDIVHDGKCSSCGTQVRFQRSEGRVTHDQREGSFVTVECPVCHALIYSNIY